MSRPARRVPDAVVSSGPNLRAVAVYLLNFPRITEPGEH